MKAVIMAGGKGTRIQSVRNDIPKPMIPLCGKPILQYQIENLKENNITDITIVIGYLGNFIKEYFKDGSNFGVNISYFEETSPLGTAGALFEISLKEDFLLLCGDLLFSLDLERLVSFHKEHNALATLVAHPNNHPYDSSILVTENILPDKPGSIPVDMGKVVKWLAKEDEREYYKNLTNAGIEVINPRLLELAKNEFNQADSSKSRKKDLDRDILKPYLKTEKIYAYKTTEYIKDMGTPDRYTEAEEDIKSGKLFIRNLIQKQKAIFLDRDGTLNKPNGFITRPEEFELFDNVPEVIKKINKSDFLVVIVTNQPVIARGECAFDDLIKIHDKLETELGRAGAYIDGIYYCPHHTDKGFTGERPEYKINCSCRKPKPGLLLQAAEELNIDLSQSYMIGDSENDVLAGNNAGCRESIKISNENELESAIIRVIAQN